MSRFSRTLTAALGALVLSVTGLMLPSPAAAATPTITETGDGYHFIGGPENNNVQLSISAGRLIIHDEGATSFGYVGSKCVAIPVEMGAAVSCRYKSPTVFHADLGDGDDAVNGSTMPQNVKLDVRTGSGENVVSGGAGIDTLQGQTGTDYFDGGTNNDRLTVGRNGGSLVGGPGHDTLVGSAGFDVIFGEAGNDSVRSLGGNDIIRGDAGNDSLSGEGDDDLILGGAGQDTVYGGDGNDHVNGGTGRDALAGNGGDDQLRARDATRDSVNCGEGTDSATVDPPAYFFGFAQGGDTVSQCEATVDSGPLDPAV